MKKTFLFAAIIAALSMSAFAQAKPPDFTGTWILDVSKSQLGDRMRVESMTLTVAQTDKELKVTTETKRAALPADAPQGGPGGGGRGLGRGFGGGDSTITYSLGGKETVVEIDGPNGKMPVKYTAAVDAGKAILTSSRSLSGPMGEITMTTKDSWSLSAEGKTLTVVREQSTPRGTNSSTMVFAKK
ncbi:MAG: hypothetical protein ABIV48_08545 [Pyrinomonadaceae bacterium]